MVEFHSLRHWVQKLRAISTPLWVGYSGGLDSHVLLHWLVSLEIPIQAIHIHHGLQPEADVWQRHCETICQQLNVRFICERVEVQTGHHGLEAAAREARHRIWQQQLAGQQLCLAHHADDQAETILLRLLRGSGPQGLSGMASEFKLGTVTLLRPFLEISQQELQAYAQYHQLSYIIDSSNQNTQFDRNYLRHLVMPLLRQRWRPAAAFAKSAAACYLTHTALMHHMPDILEHKVLSFATLASYPEAMQISLIRTWIAHHTKQLPSQNKITAVLAMLSLSVGTQAEVYITSTFYIRCYDRKIWLVTHLPAIHIMPYMGQDIIYPPIVIKKEWVDAQLKPWNASQDHVFIRARQEGDHIQLHPKGVKQKLKKYFQSRRIPPWQRAHLPLLVLNNICIAVFENTF